MEEELGVPWEDVFESIEPTPMAAGTIGQVHRPRSRTATGWSSRCSGRTRATDIYRDLGLLELFAAKTADRRGSGGSSTSRPSSSTSPTSLRRELDFRKEAANIERMREVLGRYSRLEVPQVYRELSSARLLVMQEVEGVPVRQAPEGAARTEAASQLLESYYQQILAVGFFHADPHPGNLQVVERADLLPRLRDGRRGRPGDARALLLLLMAFWREDVRFLTDVLLIMSGDDRRADLDVGQIESELGRLVGTFSARLAEGDPARADAPGHHRDRSPTTTCGFPPRWRSPGRRSPRCS